MVKTRSDDGVHRLPGRDHVFFALFACPFSKNRYVEVFGVKNISFTQGLYTFWSANCHPKKDKLIDVGNDANDLPVVVFSGFIM